MFAVALRYAKKKKRRKAKKSKTLIYLFILSKTNLKTPN